MPKKKPKNRKDISWAEAKRRCHLSAEDIRMAKEMGLTPRSLIKNIPSKSQQWKAPVRVWIREMYEKRQAKAARKRGSSLFLTEGIDKKTCSALSGSSS